MKRVFLIVFMLILVASLSSCGMKSDNEIAKDNFSRLITRINNKDKEGIKKLFCDDASNLVDLEEEIDLLFDYYTGDYVSKISHALVTKKEKNNSDTIKYQEIPYDVTTSDGVYSFAAKWIIEDCNKSSVGLWSLCVIKKEDNPNPDNVYWGDGSWTVGININKPYDNQLN